MANIVPMNGKTVQFRESSGKRNITNGKTVYLHALILDVKDQPLSALVEYERYNGSSSPLGLWTNLLEVVPIIDIFEVA